MDASLSWSSVGEMTAVSFEASLSDISLTVLASSFAATASEASLSALWVGDTSNNSGNRILAFKVESKTSLSRSFLATLLVRLISYSRRISARAGSFCLIKPLTVFNFLTWELEPRNICWQAKYISLSSGSFCAILQLGSGHWMAEDCLAFI